MKRKWQVGCWNCEVGLLGGKSAQTKIFMNLEYRGTSQFLPGESPAVTKKRPPMPKLNQQVERLARLPTVQYRVVMQMLDGVLGHAGSR